MKLQFVAEETVEGGTRGRKPMYPWAEFFEELYKHPGKWAKFPIEVKNAASAYKQRDKYKDIEARCVGDKETGLWTAYFKFTPSDDTF
jgi:hypothetical protein